MGEMSEMKLSELEKLAGYTSNKDIEIPIDFKEQKDIKQPIGLRGFKNTEKAIAQRKEMLTPSLSKAKEEIMEPLLAGGGISLPTALGVVGGGLERLSSAVTNPVLEYIKRSAGGEPENALQTFLQGLQGQRVSRPGDIVRYQGLKYGEPLAKAYDFAGDALIASAMFRAIGKLSKTVRFGKDAVVDIAKQAQAGRGFIQKAKSTLFESQLNKIKDGYIGADDIDDLATAIDDISSRFPDEGLKSIARRMLKRIRDDSGIYSKRLSAKDLHNMKQEARKLVPRAVWKGRRPPTAEEKEAQKVYFKIVSYLEKIGGKEYAGLTQDYKAWSDTVDDLNSAILERGRPGDIKLRGSFFSPGGTLSRNQYRALEIVNRGVPNEMKFMNAFNAWRRGQYLKRYGGMGLLGNAILNKTLGVIEESIPIQIENKGNE